MTANLLADGPGLAALAADLRTGRRDPADVVADRYDRIDAVDGQIEAWVDGPKPRAWTEAEAAALTERHPDPADRPPLFGVPVGVKDIVHVDGLPTKAGSDIPPGELVGDQAAVVDDLRAAGALTLGKTVTTEFAHAAPGPTRNPHDPGHTPGGSSSGSAAAVAAGMCPLALGSQTIGSVVRPASFCGIVGLKPTYGRIPTDGVFPYSPAVDTLGLFTRGVAGAALGASVACGEWRPASPGGRPVVGVPDDSYLAQATETGRERFERAVDALDDAGYVVRRTTVFDDIAGVNSRHHDLIGAEAADEHHDRYERHADRLAPQTRELVEEGREVTAGALARGRRSRVALRDRLHDLMDDEDVDVWVAPGAPDTAPEGIESTGDPVMDLPWTHAGVPVLSLPAGLAEGLPYGVQFAGRFDADERLLAWGTDLADAVAGAV